MGVFIIAEAGVNHNGSVNLAHELIDIASKAGANAIKFQTFQAEKLVAKSAKKAAYQLQNTGEGNQFEMLKSLELPEDSYDDLIAHCIEKNIEFMSTPFDLNSAEFLLKKGMKKIKVPSGELTNLPFIKELAAFNKPMIVSSGMADMDEVLDAVNSIKSVWSKNNNESTELTILHCTSNYPAAPYEVNLLAMKRIANELGVEVGYSDHTNGLHVSAAAVALGAKIIEKHFTSSRQLPGPDHVASLESNELMQLVTQIRDIENSLGDGIKRPMQSEQETRVVARRSLVAIKNLNKGEKLSASDIDILRPGDGIPPKSFDLVLGREIKKPITAGSVIRWEDLF